MRDGRPFVVWGLISICGLVWVWSAISPFDLEAWVLEQIAVALTIALLLWLTRTVPLSNTSLVSLSVLFVAHAIGTHYTYSLTPYDAVGESLFGVSIDEVLGFERNNYDRFVHLLFGLTTAKVLYELIRGYANVSSNEAWFFGLHLNISISAIYEMMEWAAALVFSDGAGTHYLGAQGDIWDAHYDIVLALIGFLFIYFVSVSGLVRFDSRDVKHSG